jgi:hypothetical protein
MNNNSPQPEIIFSAEGFTAGAGLLAHADEKARKLHRHIHPRVGAVRIRVVWEEPHFSAPRFTVCVHTHRAGADCVVHSIGVRPEPAIDAAFRKLERVLASLTGEKESNRRHPHPVEFAVSLPKA